MVEYYTTTDVSSPASSPSSTSSRHTIIITLPEAIDPSYIGSTLPRANNNVRIVDNKPACSICLDHESKEKRFFNKCKCKGTSRIHKACLIEWIKKKPHTTKCPLCNTPFKYKKTFVFTKVHLFLIACTIVSVLTLSFGIYGRVKINNNYDNDKNCCKSEFSSLVACSIFMTIYNFMCTMVAMLNSNCNKSVKLLKKANKELWIAIVYFLILDYANSISTIIIFKNLF